MRSLDSPSLSWELILWRVGEKRCVCQSRGNFRLAFTIAGSLAIVEIRSSASGNWWPFETSSAILMNPSRRWPLQGSLNLPQQPFSHGFYIALSRGELCLGRSVPIKITQLTMPFRPWLRWFLRCHFCLHLTPARAPEPTAWTHARGSEEQVVRNVMVQGGSTGVLACLSRAEQQWILYD